MRKCELLHLPSFAAHSCLVTHDRGNNGAEELGQGKERTIKPMEIGRLSAPALILCNLIIIWYHSRHRRNWARGFFSCSINHMSSWLGFRLFTYLRLLWVIPTKAESVPKKKYHWMDVSAQTVTLSALNLPSPSSLDIASLKTIQLDAEQMLEFQV